MNTKKARAIRRRIYVDMAHSDREVYYTKDGELRNHSDSLRAIYQAAKRNEVKP